MHSIGDGITRLKWVPLAAWTSDMWELQNEGYFVLEDTDIWEASDSHRRRFERKRSYYLETYKRRTREPP